MKDSYTVTCAPYKDNIHRSFQIADLNRHITFPVLI